MWGAVSWPDANYLLLDGKDSKKIADGNSKDYSNQVGGTGATWSCNTSKYSYGNTSCTFYGNNFAKGLKSESATWTQVITTATSTLTIVQSLATNASGSLDIETVGSSPSNRTDINSFDANNLIVNSYSGTQTVGGKTYKDVKVYKLCNLPAGTYKIYRGTDPTDQTYVVYMGITYATTSTVAITTSTAGGGSISGGGSYVVGAKAKLTATPSDGYIFSKWQKGGADFSGNTSNPLTVTVDAAATYTAVFEVAVMHNIAVSIAAGQDSYGSVTGGGEVVESTDATITAAPGVAYKFEKWVIDGDDEHPVTTNPYTFSSVADDHTAVAYFVARKIINYSVTDGSKGTTTIGLSTEYANDADKFTAPYNYYIAKDGNTLTAWTDGENNYIPGTEYTLDGNITLEPVFTVNSPSFSVALSSIKTNTVVTWDFDYNGGKAPKIHVENNTGYYVQQATMSEKSYDFVMAIDNTTGSAISGIHGKTYNFDRDNAQMSRGSKLTIPAKKGMTIVAYSSSGNFLAADDKSDADESKWKYATTIGGVVASSGTGTKTATWVYNGESSTIDYVAGNDANYISKIVVTYPAPKYSVTYSYGTGSGTVPTETDKFEDEVFTLAGKGSMVAPTNKGFIGWLCDVDDELYLGGSSYTMTSAATTFTAQYAPIIIKATPTSGSAATVTGLIGGTADVSLTKDGTTYKFGDDNAKLGITLSSGTFHTGDRINVHITKADDTGGKIIFYNDDKSIIWNTGVKGVVGDNVFELPVAANGKTKLYLYRINASNKWNAYIDYVEVTRTFVSGTITSAGWNTFSNECPLDLSTISGGTAYYASDAAGSTVTLKSTTAIVPAGEGLMIKGTPNDVFTINVATSGTSISGNKLVGLPNGGTVVKDDNNYVFGWPSADATDFGFYLVNSTEPVLGAGKAYLHTTGLTPAPSLRILEDENNATGIQNIEDDAEAVKFIKNGQLLIKRDGVVYDAMGRVIR